LLLAAPVLGATLILVPLELTLFVALLLLGGALAAATATLLPTALLGLLLSGLLSSLLLSLPSGLELSGPWISGDLLGLLALLLSELLGVTSIGDPLIGTTTLLPGPARLPARGLLLGWDVALL